MSPLCGIYRSTRLGGQVTSPRDKEGYHGITSILKYHIWSCLIYSNNYQYKCSIFRPWIMAHCRNCAKWNRTSDSRTPTSFFTRTTLTSHLVLGYRQMPFRCSLRWYEMFWWSWYSDNYFRSSCLWSWYSDIFHIWIQLQHMGISHSAWFLRLMLCWVHLQPSIVH